MGMATGIMWKAQAREEQIFFKKTDSFLCELI